MLPLNLKYSDFTKEDLSESLKDEICVYANDDFHNLKHHKEDKILDEIIFRVKQEFFFNENILKINYELDLNYKNFNLTFPISKYNAYKIISSSKDKSKDEVIQAIIKECEDNEYRFFS